MIDLHSHILPGLDDGAPDLEASLAMARMAVCDGVRTIVGTPHIPATGACPSPEAIRERVAQLQAAVAAEDLPLTILPGAECEAGEELAQRLQAGEVLTVGGFGRHVLLEVPFNGQTAFIEHIVFALQLAGYTPILAHPERSQFARARPESLRNLTERGCLVQVNACSVLGREGRGVKAVVRSLLRAGLVDFIATDSHDTRRRPPLLTPCRAALRRMGGAEAFASYTDDNPARIARQPDGAGS
jgi:protein-tyrosine phosphatase